MESGERDKWCASILECKRQCRRGSNALKGKMRADRRLQNLVPKARTKKELAQRKTDEEQLAAYQKEQVDCVHEWTVQNSFRNDTMLRCGDAKIARLERLLCDAGGEW